MDANPMGADSSFEAAVAKLRGPVTSEPKKPTEKVETEDKADSAETPEGDTETPVAKYKVKVNGEEQEVTIDDLLKSYMMESDYRAKTTHVAEQRRDLEAKLADIDTRHQEAKELLEAEREDLESEDMKLMKEIDPDWYWKKANGIDAREKRLNASIEKRKQEAKAKHAEKLGKEREKLTQLVPDWLDGTKQAAEIPEIGKLMQDLGYNVEELNELSDSRIFALARKAWQFDQINKQDPGAKRVKEPTVTAKPGASSSKETVKTSKEKDMRAKLSKTGHIVDAQALIRHKFFGD